MEGGLMSYAASNLDLARRSAYFVDHISGRRIERCKKTHSHPEAFDAQLLRKVSRLATSSCALTFQKLTFNQVL
jgi:hypothetical protein